MYIIICTWFLKVILASYLVIKDLNPSISLIMIVISLIPYT